MRAKFLPSLLCACILLAGVMSKVEEAAAMPAKEAAVWGLCKNAFGLIGGAGVMGNIAVETGGSFDYQQRQHNNGPGYGLFQFEKPMRGDYNAYLKAHSASDSAASQVNYVKDQLQHGKYIGAGHAKKIRDAFASGDVVKATTEFCNRFERPSVPHLANRIAAAKKYAAM